MENQTSGMGLPNRSPTGRLDPDLANRLTLDRDEGRDVTKAPT